MVLWVKWPRLKVVVAPFNKWSSFRSIWVNLVRREATWSVRYYPCFIVPILHFVPLLLLHSHSIPTYRTISFYIFVLVPLVCSVCFSAFSCFICPFFFLYQLMASCYGNPPLCLLLLVSKAQSVSHLFVFVLLVFGVFLSCLLCWWSESRSPETQSRQT